MEKLDWGFLSAIKCFVTNKQRLKQYIAFVNFDVLSLSNPNVTVDWLLSFPEGSWNFCMLSSHQNLNVQWILALPHKSWL